MTAALYGIGVCKGVGIGPAYVLNGDELNIPEIRIDEDEIDAEIERFENAIELARQDLDEIRRRVPSRSPLDLSSFIDTHLLMLADDALVKVPAETIRSRRCNAEWALKLQRDALIQIFRQMEDPYLRTRIDDVNYVVQQVQRILLNHPGHFGETIDLPLKGHIVVADDLSPAEIILLQHRGISALVTEFGGSTSHTAIMARSIGVPAVVGASHLRRFVLDQELVIVDADRGLIILTPTEQITAYYRCRQHEQAVRRDALARLKGRPTVSGDQQAITLLANIEVPEDVAAVRQVAAEGVGLFRTEYLYMNRETPPDEEEQYEAFRSVVECIGGPVTIRTLDVGGDKKAAFLSAGSGRIANPALGLRAVRLCLREQSLFRPQLRAILRASVHGDVRLMLPMISTVDEVIQVRQLVEELKAELRRDGLGFDENISVGGMVETPAAALCAPMLLRYLDFLSLGTNDLIQYTIATDRMDESVNYLYDPLHPAVLRLIQLTIEAGYQAGKAVSLCGEMAGDARFTFLLLAMGLREFSVHPGQFLEVKSRIADCHIAGIQDRFLAAIASGDPRRIRETVDDFNQSVND